MLRSIRSLLLQLLALFHLSLVPARLAEKHLHFALHHIHHARLLVVARIRIAARSSRPSLPLRRGTSRHSRLRLGRRNRQLCSLLLLIWRYAFFCRTPRLTVLLALPFVFPFKAALLLFCCALLLRL